jgi:hypothetical protein
MKTLAKCLVTVSFVVLAGLAAAPAALADGVDDVASFYVADRLQVGSVHLEPGVYVVRALHAGSSRNVLVVSTADGTKARAALLVTPHQIAAHENKGTSRLLYEPADGARPAALRTFLVANSSFGYDVLPSAGTARVASLPVREIVALASAR